MFSRRAYPQVSGREQREAKARLMAVLFNDEVPDPRDTLLPDKPKPTIDPADTLDPFHRKK